MVLLIPIVFALFLELAMSFRSVPADCRVVRSLRRSMSEATGGVTLCPVVPVAQCLEHFYHL